MGGLRGAIGEEVGGEGKEEEVEKGQEVSQNTYLAYRPCRLKAVVPSIYMCCS